MDEDTKRLVYDPFFTTKGTGRGTGPGLFIVHTVVSNHEGFINQYSESGRGTRIFVYIPVTTSGVKAGEQQPVDLRGEGTILVIDDDDGEDGLSHFRANPGV